MTRDNRRNELLASYSIGLKLKTLRTEKRLTLVRLSAETGLSSALLSKLETGLMIPTLPTLAKICGVFGVGLGYFFCETEHHSLAITRGAHMIEGRREQPVVRMIPLHVPNALSKLNSQVIDMPLGSTLRMSEPGSKTELTAYLLEGSLGVVSAGSEEQLSPGDCIVLDTDSAVLFSARGSSCRVLTVIAKSL